jgi:hypothetical protein
LENPWRVLAAGMDESRGLALLTGSNVFSSDFTYFEMVPFSD